MAYHLRLETIGQDVVDVVVDQIARNRSDALLRFQNVAGCAVFLFDCQQIGLAAVAEQVFEFGIEFVLTAIKTRLNLAAGSNIGKAHAKYVFDGLD